jgi:hypothetical protein
MESNGIKHTVIDMQGTKRVKIPLAVMNSVMEIALDRRNYPMLMHCNHGKVKYILSVYLPVTYSYNSIERAVWSLSFAKLWDGGSIPSSRNTQSMHILRLAKVTLNISTGLMCRACLRSSENLRTILLQQ